ncbi:regulatory protein RecX [Acetanaerobacterium elongatum]|uniref:Regulatory protein RecX n=1 Tax=Acetanaerobacterium elongatum TaxID=258515 RepID=A0A1G9V0W3_9FIRM|nr:RecX family transcriptional regulator [Acetanaerobacterium elongatum]SDM65545.1 regulatory protein [Acetanaerobacterium elongatum]
MRITAVEKTKKGRYAVFLDNVFAFSADAETTALCHLTVGRELSEDDCEQVKRQAETKYLKERALRLLSFKSFSKAELVKRLAEYTDDRSDDAALEVVERLEELGLINDKEYAARVARDYYARKGYGERRVMQELIRRGITRELAEEAAQANAPEAESALDKIIERRYAKYLTDPKGIRKTIQALARLGYPYDEIKAAISRYTDEDLYEQA